jgi:ribose-phosphate pyrophosphokinase
MILVNGKGVEIQYFPNKESKVKEFEVLGKNVVELFYEDDRDLIHLLFVRDHIKKSKCTTLIIHYMPYSRMDRKIEGDVFTLITVCGFINVLEFDDVIVIEPHSNKTMSLLYDAKAIYPIIDWLPQIIIDTDFCDNDCFIFPDESALERYFGMLVIFQPGMNYRSFKKLRNEQTGQILEMKLTSDLPQGCQKCIIIDDLCSKGGTFLWAGNILRENGVKDITLVVAHLEDTVFDGELLTGTSPIDRIYTSNSIIRSEPHRKIIVLPIKIDT